MKGELPACVSKVLDDDNLLRETIVRVGFPTSLLQGSGKTGMAYEGDTRKLLDGLTRALSRKSTGLHFLCSRRNHVLD
ncbi:hypothetical protein ZWY2020_015036 [Hordeum vulgare]|nr:hypothetical protein ZWY2020_015036 [Hordeum vulgare]